jgi:hypothetical protein
MNRSGDHLALDDFMGQESIDDLIDYVCAPIASPTAPDMKNDETRLIPHTGPRVETGPVKFGDDWTGVFIRGDNAFGMAMGLRALLSGASAPRSLLHNTLAVVTLTGLIELLESAN